jgi:farnesol dehydrogenase
MCSRTLITGASGFTGDRLARRLAADGSALRCLVRSEAAAADLTARGIEAVIGDIRDKESVKRAVEGCNRVFHLAAYARNWAADPNTYTCVNVIGFVNVAEAALEQSVHRFVLTSSSVVSGPTGKAVADETTPGSRADFFTEYEKSKYSAEREAAVFLDRGLPLVVVRPTRVYGPGRLTEGNSVTIMIDKFLRGRFPFLLDGGRQTGNYVYIDDVIEGHLRAMTDGRIGEVYILGGENSRLRDFFAVVSEVSGRNAPRLPMPPGLARTVARMELGKAKLSGLYPLITPGWVDTFLADWAYSSEKAKAELGYSGRGLKEGIKLTVEWLRHKKRGP